MNEEQRQAKREYLREHYKKHKDRYAERDAQRDWSAKRQQHRDRIVPVVNKLKDVPCADCGIEYPPYVLDFDHCNGIKVTNVSRLVNQGVGLPRILDEIAKCEVVCSNCHRIRTWERREAFLGGDWIIPAPCP